MRLLFCLLLVSPLAADWTPEQKDLEIPMRDGKSLLADLYLPPAEGKYPAVLIQTPYNKVHMGAPITGDLKDPGDVGRGSVSDALGLLDREHYAYVVVDWRGFYASKAAMDGVDKKKWKRGQDGYDAVEWVAEQPWSDGKVGTWGGSALGKQQLDTAAEQPPHLVCCVPLIASMGQRYECYYEGGCYLEAHVKTLDFLGYGVSKMVLANPRPGTLIWRGAERLSYHPEKIQVPCLMISGWWDHYPGQVIETFEDIVAKGGPQAREHSKLLFGPWDHVGVGLAKQGDREFKGAELESARSAKAYFDFFLRGEKNDWDKTPRIRYWRINEEGWASADKWKGLERASTTLFLGADGTIGPKSPDEQKTLSYVCDPKDPTPTLGGANLPPLPHGPRTQNALEKRKDLLVYSTGKLTSPLTLNGNATLSFQVEVDRPCCDFMARLCDVGPDGKSYLLADAAVRIRDAKAGARQDVTLTFPTTAATWPEGWDLRIYLSSSNWPRYEKNTHNGADHWEAADAEAVNVTVVHPAKLTLPSLAGGK